MARSFYFCSLLVLHFLIASSSNRVEHHLLGLCGESLTFTGLNDYSSMWITATAAEMDSPDYPESCEISIIKPSGFELMVTFAQFDAKCEDATAITKETPVRAGYCLNYAIKVGEQRVINEPSLTFLRSTGVNVTAADIRLLFTLFQRFDETHTCPNKEDSYPCRNERCIYKGLNCNGLDECGDNSDEKECWGSADTVYLIAFSILFVVSLAFVLIYGFFKK